MPRQPRLLLLIALVLLVHAYLLQQAAPTLWPWSAADNAPTAASRPLSAALPKPAPSPVPAIAPAPVPAQAITPPAPAPVQRPLTHPAASTRTAVQPATTRGASPVTTSASDASAARSSATEPAPAPKAASASASAATASPEASGTPPAGGAAPSTTLLAATELPAARPIKLPPPARLLYDGKGEEHGLSFSASGELLWLPDGAQYNARLEITFLLARLRTWTSKGSVADNGLQPLRFGDKPRGAELATHFQRDKGIISFSANNPDVPLQIGAQDKLSSLLQLSALVAGDPARYGAGSSIRFQAADAHRAELWDFRVGPAESLELPGGTLATVKLTKEPTAEFDQRIEVWLAPAQSYLPVRLRITESNGALVDLQWRKTLKPDPSP